MTAMRMGTMITVARRSTLTGRGTLAVAVLALAACGGGGPSGAQGEVVDTFDELASEQGIDFDRGCVEDLAADLSDDDAEAIVAAGTDGDAEISDEGEAIGERVFDQCVDVESYRDAIIEQLEESDDSIDADCIREALGDASTASEIEDAVFSAAFDCVNLDG